MVLRSSFITQQGSMHKGTLAAQVLGSKTSLTHPKTCLVCKLPWAYTYGVNVELEPESLKVSDMGLRQCSPQEWCWLDSTVSCLVLVERLLDLWSVAGSFPTEPVTCEAHPLLLSGAPNPDIAEHWVHKIERVFVTMRCSQTDRVILATYQLRGFAQEWWRLKMQTVFAGRPEDTISWHEFLTAFNDTFFPVQIQQVKREQFRTLQQGNLSVLEYQMRFMALSRYAPYVVTDNTMMVEYFIKGLRAELQDAVIPLMCRTVEEAAQRVAILERTVRARQGQSQTGGSGSFQLSQQSTGISKGKAPSGASSSSGFVK
ncbi:hypothetical protein Taro_034854 [Colocasia esculenta]|uniref:Retrotransposon gag domain-containing protein n=1 Tax=Colocasia esculenta TaxID=4460 RepID=A0A843VXG9_COLES|nr:hypothetical protein [Colocasia esculenta]